MNPAAGLAAISSAYSLCALVEIRITVPLSRRARSKPLSSPRRMSTSTTSGRSSCSSRRASALVVATPATATPSRSSSTRAASRNGWLSSTMRQRTCTLSCSLTTHTKRIRAARKRCWWVTTVMSRPRRVALSRALQRSSSGPASRLIGASGACDVAIDELMDLHLEQGLGFAYAGDRAHAPDDVPECGVVGADDLDVEISAPEQTRRIGDFGHCDDEVGERVQALRLAAHQHAGQHAVAESRGVDEGQDAKGPRVLDAPHTRTNGALRDADAARDRSKRTSPVLLQFPQDRAIGVIELGLHLRRW